MTGKEPKYRRQKRHNKDLAFVELEGQRVYLGRYGTPESQQRYHALLAEWNAAGQRLPLSVIPTKNERDSGITVVELVSRFWTHVENHYRKLDGSPSSEVTNYRIALQIVKGLYGRLPIAQFTPLKLKAVRQEMIQRGWARSNINFMVGRVRRMFKWGVENELVSPEILHGLQAVSGLQWGRSEAKETEPVRPVPEANIEAVRPHVSGPVWALIQLQLYTAARSGELLGLRAIDIDTSGKVWTYSPADHKTAYRGHRRTIYMGPKAQAILQPLMRNRPVDTFLFSPCDAVVEKAARAKTHRRPDQEPNPRKTERIVRDHYDRDSYRRAIQRACEKAGIAAWHPHQLRHNAATFIRREYGLEAAQILLGHKKADITQLYAEIQQEKALQIAAKIG